MNSYAEHLIQRLIEAYRVHYDITVPELHENLKAICAYHQRDSQYVLVKKAELWAAEQHEYRYIWQFEHLDMDSVQLIFQKTLTDGEPRVNPHNQHMCTILTALVLYDSADPEALQLLKRMKKRKDYRFALLGWMEFRIAAFTITPSDKKHISIITNAAGKKLKKDFEHLLFRLI